LLKKAEKHVSYWRGCNMKIISVDDDVTAYEACNDFGIFVCGDEGRLRFGSWDEAQALIHYLATATLYHRTKLLPVLALAD
jgi:hypothetical protein